MYTYMCVYIYTHILIIMYSVNTDNSNTASHCTPCGGEVLHVCLKMSRAKRQM